VAFGLDGAHVLHTQRAWNFATGGNVEDFVLFKLTSGIWLITSARERIDECRNKT